MFNSKKSHQYLLKIMVLLFCASTALFAAKVDKIISKVQKKYQSTKTIRIDFKETSRFSLTGTETQIDATLLMEGKDKFRLESEDQVLVNNGETFWRYNKLDSQVLVDYAKKNDQEVMLNEFLFDLKDHYFGQVIDELKGEKSKKYLIKLTPKPTEQSIFTTVKIWVQDKTWEIDRLVYRDYNDNETEYVIERTAFNPDLNESVFTFTPPEGIQVIDLRF